MAAEFVDDTECAGAAIGHRESRIVLSGLPAVMNMLHTHMVQ